MEHYLILIFLHLYRAGHLYDSAAPTPLVPRDAAQRLGRTGRQHNDDFTILVPVIIRRGRGHRGAGE